MFSSLRPIWKFCCPGWSSFILCCTIGNECSLTFRQLMVKCVEHYSWYAMRAIYLARGLKLLGFACLFDDAAASSFDVFFDPSSGFIDVQGLAFGTNGGYINQKASPGYGQLGFQSYNAEYPFGPDLQRKFHLIIMQDISMMGQFPYCNMPHAYPSYPPLVPVDAYGQVVCGKIIWAWLHSTKCNSWVCSWQSAQL